MLVGNVNLILKPAFSPLGQKDPFYFFDRKLSELKLYYGRESALKNTQNVAKKNDSSLVTTLVLCSCAVQLRVNARSHHLNPFTPKSDQFRTSPTASPGILHYAVWRTWLFIAYSDGWLYYQFSPPRLYSSHAHFCDAWFWAHAHFCEACFWRMRTLATLFLAHFCDACFGRARTFATLFSGHAHVFGACQAQELHLGLRRFR